MLVPLKRSPEYGAIRKRVADLKPIDAWQLDTIHYFLFQLKPEAETVAVEPAYALFTMRWEDDGPASARVISTDSARNEVTVLNLIDGQTSTLPLSE